MKSPQAMEISVLSFIKIPLFDFIIAPILMIFFLILFFIQIRSPLRKRVVDNFKHTLINAAVAFPSALIFRLAIIPAGIFAAQWSEQHNFGLLFILQLPVWLEYIIGFLLLDISFYYWHFLNHHFSFLWRFHNVHHIDLDLDTSTAFRFHFGEMIFSIGFRALQVTLIGIPVTLFLLYELVFQAATEFHHSNMKLPIRFERWLVKCIVTPRMHGIHHSIVENETDSNFSVIFSFWDRIHKTILLNIPQDQITIGVPAYLNQTYQKISELLILPFKKQKDYWIKEDGTRPARIATDGESKTKLAV